MVESNEHNKPIHVERAIHIAPSYDTMERCERDQKIAEAQERRERLTYFGKKLLGDAITTSAAVVAGYQFANGNIPNGLIASGTVVLTRIITYRSDMNVANSTHRQNLGVKNDYL